jgi:hypothetical protein
MRVGKPVDLSKWKGMHEDPDALREATAEIMRAITVMLEEVRGEKRTPVIFDPHSSALPKTGNFVKSEKKAKKH